MCLVIDACRFSNVFNKKDVLHADFRPILLWVTNGKGKIVFGGTKYKKELAHASRYHRLLGELRKQGRVIEVKKSKVDTAENELLRRARKAEMNDSHLVAIVIASGCRLVCTRDKNAIENLKNRSLYPKGISPPKIYTKLCNKSLLCNKHIAPICE